MAAEDHFQQISNRGVVVTICNLCGHTEEGVHYASMPREDDQPTEHQRQREAMIEHVNTAHLRRA